MSTIKVCLSLAVCLLLTVALTACSKGDAPAGGSTAPDPAKALPASWYQKAEDGQAATPSGEKLDLPSAAAEKSVSHVFSASVVPLSGTGGGRQGWHLDGMETSYGVSEDGFFAPLLYSGTESIRARWQLPASSAAEPKPVAAPNGVRLDPSMSVAQVSALLEPVVKMVVHEGVVKDQAALKANLLAKALKFLGLTKIINGIPFESGWHASGLRLHLSVGGDASVTPITNVGSNVGVFFDWTRTGASPIVGNPPDDAESRNLRRLLQTVASVIPEAIAKAPELRNSNFEFNQVQIGLGELADIPAFGIADAQGELMGRVIFRRDPAVAATASAAALAVNDTVSLIRAASAHDLGFARNQGVAVQLIPPASLAAATRSDPPAEFKISADRLRLGLTKAIKMSSYFLQRADAADAGPYELRQIEAEFDASIDGDLVWVIVTGGGQFVLDFNRIQKGSKEHQ